MVERFLRETVDLPPAFAHAYATAMEEQDGVNRLRFLQDANYTLEDLKRLGVRPGHIHSLLQALDDLRDEAAMQSLTRAVREEERGIGGGGGTPPVGGKGKPADAPIVTARRGPSIVVGRRQDPGGPLLDVTEAVLEGGIRFFLPTSASSDRAAFTLDREVFPSWPAFIEDQAGQGEEEEEEEDGREDTYLKGESPPSPPRPTSGKARGHAAPAHAALAPDPTDLRRRLASLSSLTLPARLNDLRRKLRLCTGCGSEEGLLRYSPMELALAYIDNFPSSREVVQGALLGLATLVVEAEADKGLLVSRVGKTILPVLQSHWGLKEMQVRVSYVKLVTAQSSSLRFPASRDLDTIRRPRP